MLLPYDRLRCEPRLSSAQFLRYVNREGQLPRGPYRMWIEAVERLAPVLGFDPAMIWFHADWMTDGFQDNAWTSMGDTIGIALGGNVGPLRGDDAAFAEMSARIHIAAYMVLTGRERFPADYGEVRTYARSFIDGLVEQKRDPNHPPVQRLDDLCSRFTDQHGNIRHVLYRDRAIAVRIAQRAMDSGLPVPGQRYLKELHRWTEGRRIRLRVNLSDHIYEGPSRANNMRLEAVRPGDILTAIGSTSGHGPGGHILWYMLQDPEGGFINEEHVVIL